ncbi:MAG: penicillin-binding transpeptidase domain-containing protein [Pseudohongiella sp.]|nr:penicillin-binding transpeptidase domain-containing protein [Pseudohongiella sp.]MDP2127278.1 penicillin-binding transpeptidase domain-containing protein [Pseudohongiella sp.]
MLRRVCSVVFVSLFAASVVIAQPAVEGVEELPEARAALDATGFTGTTLIYDLNNERWMAGHAELVDTAALPASTFKLFSSLAALETRVIHGADEIIAWDGVTRSRTETNADMSLRDAFRISSVPHYQHLVREIGAGRMGVLLREARYGNMDMDGGLETFWLSGDLRITPRQQIEFMVRLHKADLPFRPEVIRVVKDIAMMEDTESYKLRAKTGLAETGDRENTGWWVGWVETGDNVYFFATLLLAQNPDDTFVPKRISVSRQILSQLGILPAN